MEKKLTIQQVEKLQKRATYITYKEELDEATAFMAALHERYPLLYDEVEYRNDLNPMNNGGYFEKILQYISIE